jgi:ATP-dependent Clp endopeptidase proteolytic subunit ClpP
MDNQKNDEILSSESNDIINIVESDNAIHFNAGITPKSVSTLIDKLLSLEEKILKKQRTLKRKFSDIKKDDEEYEDKIEIYFEPKPIKLYITSNGGLVRQVFSAIDTIKNMRVPVHTICKGMVASAGTLLSLAGSKRFITENSYMLIHELRAGHYGKFAYLQDSFENSKQLMDHIKSYYIKNTKLTTEELDEQLKKDVAWNAEMCLEKGLVDEIIKFKK